MNTAASALTALERRVEQMLSQFESLRLDNTSLRNKLLETQGERDELRARVNHAAERLEALKDKLPFEP